MGLLAYDPMEDGESASANLWNVRLSAIHDLLNGNIDAANLANNAVTTAKIANGAVTSEKLGFERYEDDNGWMITDLGLVKLATKRKPFTLPATSQNNSKFGEYAAGVNNAPVGFNPSASFNIIHMPYMLGVNHAVGGWDLKMKEEDGVGFMLPDTPVVGTRLYPGTSASNEPGVVETWVIF